MKHFSFLLDVVCHAYLHLLLFTLTLTWFIPNRTIAFSLGNQTDHLTLLQFKDSISNDPNGVLDYWNSSTHFCNWHGIICSHKHQRVAVLSLQGYELHGSISPHIGNLSFLRNLNLAKNNFFGNIPNELGRLFRLQQLFLTNNSLSGEIPINLTHCSNLEGLHLGGNNLIGKIPIEITSLRKLQVLIPRNNKLTGGVPSFIGNLSSLILLSIGCNNFEGSIPDEICRLKNLTVISMFNNKLSGTFPSCLYTMSSLTLISATANYFAGILPPNMFKTLSNLQDFEIAGNQIAGPIPTSIANASSLTLFEIAHNYFVGHIPSLGMLENLSWIHVAENNLGENSTKDLNFLKSLENCSKLIEVDIGYNNFGSSFPNSIGNLSTQLSQLKLGGNMISGKIPVEIGNLVGLALLDINLNKLDGIIPSTLGKIQNMQSLDLSQNKLSGVIPTTIGNLSLMFNLNLGKNKLEGNIPPSIRNCQKLQSISVGKNNLRGTISLEVFTLSSLSILLDLSKNSFSGSLPKEVGMLTKINYLDISDNHLSSNIPETISECISLEYLQLQGNSFNGTLPSSLGALKGLRYLDLSRNQLYGPIPDVMKSISGLEYLNVSFNILEGEVPTDGVFGNATRVAMVGNNKLCGGISELHLPPCLIKGTKHKKNHNFKLIAVIISVVSFLLILSLSIAIYWMSKRNQKPYFDSPTIDQLAKVSYQELHQGTDGFSDRNMIGSGSFGFVYRGNLVLAENIVAVKVLNLQKKGAHKSFIVECNALKNIRHRNLVKILTCCSGTDYKGQEFKALVFDYMKNGSLEQWLHPVISNEEHPTTLDFGQRLNIIIDVASALHYLHQECENCVVHCDLKPSNVLLDDDMVAHVSDFGIAKLVSATGGNTSTIGIKGTIGYAPPEYGMGSEVSTCGDMYSFGILMLEMLTGRRPTDEVFQDGQNLHNFVAIAFPDNIIEILDPHLVSIEDGNRANLIPCVEESLVSLFRIGLICSMESPKERMNIVDVTRELSTIRKAFLAGFRTPRN